MDSDLFRGSIHFGAFGPLVSLQSSLIFFFTLKISPAHSFTHMRPTLINLCGYNDAWLKMIQTHDTNGVHAYSTSNAQCSAGR